MHNELGWMWKEKIATLFKVLSRHLPGWAEENHEQFQSSVMIGDIRAGV
jgi:hypothetical protein